MDPNSTTYHPLPEHLEFRERSLGYQEQFSPPYAFNASSQVPPWMESSPGESFNGPQVKLDSYLLGTDADSMSKSKDSGIPWRTGFWVRFPVLAIAALIGILACTICALVVLITSNGKITDTWGYGHQPSLYLAIISIVSNIFIALALSAAIRISFKLLKEDQDLHDYWQSADSVPGAFRSIFQGRAKRNALAFIVVTLSVIRAPLNQQATTVRADVIFPKNGSVELLIAQQLPPEYAGVTERLRGHSTLTSRLTPDFNTVMNSYSQRTQLTLQNLTTTNDTSSCSGKCSFTVKAFGFKPVCQTTIIPGDLVPSGLLDDGDGIPWNAFSTDGVILAPPGQEEYFEFGATATLGLNATFFRSGFENESTNHLCNLTGGILSYPVTVSAGIITLDLEALAENGTFDGFQPQTLLKPITTSFPNNTIIGGFQFAAHYLFNSSGYFYGDPTVSTWLLDGPLANQYFVTSDSSHGNEGSRFNGFRDPMADMISTIHQIAFRAAIQAANSTQENSIQIAEYTGTEAQIIYVTRYPYMICSAILSLASIIALAPLFWGWWLLGEKFSMSPLEIARAFDAPLLRGVDGSTDAEGLASGLEDIKVRYGVSTKESSKDKPRLRLDHEDHIVAPRQGWIYS